MKFAIIALSPFYLLSATLVGAVPFSNGSSAIATLPATPSSGLPSATASTTTFFSSNGTIFPPTSTPPNGTIIASLPATPSATTVVTSTFNVPSASPSNGCDCIQPPIWFPSDVPTASATTFPTFLSASDSLFDGTVPASASATLVTNWFAPHGYPSAFPPFPSSSGCVCATPATPFPVSIATSSTNATTLPVITAPSATPSQVACPINVTVFTTTVVEYVTVYPSSVDSSVLATATPSTVSFPGNSSSTALSSTVLGTATSTTTTV